jgi:hypothetical protein
LIGSFAPPGAGSAIRDQIVESETWKITGAFSGSLCGSICAGFVEKIVLLLGFV